MNIFSGFCLLSRRRSIDKERVNERPFSRFCRAKNQELSDMIHFHTRLRDGINLPWTGCVDWEGRNGWLRRWRPSGPSVKQCKHIQLLFFESVQASSPFPILELCLSNRFLFADLL